MRRVTERVSSNHGVTLSVDWWSNGARDAAVIICPGFFQSKDTVTFQRMSQVIAERYDVLAMDFRGHGQSSGRFTFSAREGVDLEAVLRIAQARYRRLAVLGFSLGAATAINTLSRRPERVQTLVAVSAPSSFEEIEFKFWTPEAMRTGLQGLEAGAGCRPGNPWLKKERPIETIRQIRIPIYFIHGTRDVIVGIQHSHRLHAAAGEPKQLAIIDSGSHAEALFRDEPQRFTDLVHRWLAQTIPSSSN